MPLVDTVLEDPRWRDLPALAETAARAVMAQFDLEPDAYEICVMGCDDARIAELNGDFRARPQATNVLSWPSEERAADEGQPPALPDPGELGDIAIAYDTCAREATEAGRSMADHVTHLIIHAVLHLMGYDHIRDADATLMEGIEVEILGKLGIENPYI